MPRYTASDFSHCTKPVVIASISRSSLSPASPVHADIMGTVAVVTSVGWCEADDGVEATDAKP